MENKEALLNKDGLKRKEKEDSDDTTSYEGDTDRDADDFDYVVSAKKSRRSRRKAYKDFKKANKAFWMWFNLVIAFFSAGFLTGTYFVLEYNQNDCANLRVVLYAVICLHAVNILMTLINLCGLEVKLCNSNMVCCFIMFEITMLAWMQVSYFNSMSRNCLTNVPNLFLWTFGQILAIYMGLAIVICHFFRKFCQDPDLEEEEEEAGPQGDIEATPTPQK